VILSEGRGELFQVTSIKRIEERTQRWLFGNLERWDETSQSVWRIGEEEKEATERITTLRGSYRQESGRKQMHFTHLHILRSNAARYSEKLMLEESAFDFDAVMPESPD
jgi:hypothetical protein